MNIWIFNYGLNSTSAYKSWKKLKASSNNIFLNLIWKEVQANVSSTIMLNFMRRWLWMKIPKWLGKGKSLACKIRDLSKVFVSIISEFCDYWINTIFCQMLFVLSKNMIMIHWILFSFQATWNGLICGWRNFWAK